MKTIFIFSILISICFLSCTNTQKTNKSITTNIEQQNTEKKNTTLLNAGVDFIANGDSPTTWELTLNYEDSIRFKTNDGIALTFATNKCNRTETPVGIKFYTTIKKETIEINIFTNLCDKKRKTQIVTVQYIGKTYTGCGSYLKNSALNNKWILYKIRGKFVEDYKTTPTLLIDIDKNICKGNDGCNNLNASIIVQGDKIIFNEIKFSKNTCSDNDFTTILKKQMSNQIANYFFKDGKLYLYLIDDSLLAFKPTN